MPFKLIIKEIEVLYTAKLIVIRGCLLEGLVLVNQKAKLVDENCTIPLKVRGVVLNNVVACNADEVCITTSYDPKLIKQLAIGKAIYS